MQKFSVLLAAASVYGAGTPAQEGHLKEHAMYNPAYGAGQSDRNVKFRNSQNSGLYNSDPANNAQVKADLDVAADDDRRYKSGNPVNGDYLYRTHEESEIVPFLMRNAYGVLGQSLYQLTNPMLGFWLRPTAELNRFKHEAKRNIKARDQLVTVKKSMSKEDPNWQQTNMEIKQAVKELKRLRKFASVESMLQYVAPMPMPFGAYFEYGCFCFQGGYAEKNKTQHRHGAQPVDAIDTACRYHMWAYHCASRDFSECNGKVHMYEWDGVMEEVDGRMVKTIVCKEEENTCGNAICQADKFLAEQLSTLYKLNYKVGHKKLKGFATEEQCHYSALPTDSEGNEIQQRHSPVGDEKDGRHFAGDHAERELQIEQVEFDMEAFGELVGEDLAPESFNWGEIDVQSPVDDPSFATQYLFPVQEVNANAHLQKAKDQMQLSELDLYKDDEAIANQRLDDLTNQLEALEQLVESTGTKIADENADVLNEAGIAADDMLSITTDAGETKQVKQTDLQASINQATQALSVMKDRVKRKKKKKKTQQLELLGMEDVVSKLNEIASDTAGMTSEQLADHIKLNEDLEDQLKQAIEDEGSEEVKAVATELADLEAAVAQLEVETSYVLDEVNKSVVNWADGVVEAPVEVDDSNQAGASSHGDAPADSTNPADYNDCADGEWDETNPNCRLSPEQIKELLQKIDDRFNALRKGSPLSLRQLNVILSKLGAYFQIKQVGAGQVKVDVKTTWTQLKSDVAQLKECCGTYPQRYMFDSTVRGCCDNKIYDRTAFECCSAEGRASMLLLKWDQSTGATNTCSNAGF